MTEPVAIEVVLVELEHARATATLDVAARVAIGNRLGVYPSVVAIDREPSGRPVADGVALSLSHSGTIGAIAIGDPGARVGVDVEVLRARRHVDRIARRVFTPDELVMWAALAEAERLRAFLQRWTEVEAVLKARGTGIAGGFANAVPLPTGWSCEPIDGGAEFVGTVAAEAPALEVRTRRFGPLPPE